MSIKELDQTFVAHTYNRFDIEIVSGKGSVVTDSNGKNYIDMGSGIGVTSFGICDEVWKNAVIEQLSKVQHTSNLYYTEPCAKLAELLCKKTNMSKVFFSNSGAEANECAIKVARKYAAETKGKDYSTIVTLTNSFHGRTLTTLSATGQQHYHELYNPLTAGFCHTSADCFEEFIALCAHEKIAAVMIECIQGEGGVIALDKNFVTKLYNYAKKHDILFIVDEVQTGNGRTGKFYSYMHYGIEPDIVSTAKGLGGGLPIGATLLGRKVENVFGYSDHGSTYGGNPVSCAAAISVVNRINDNLLEEVNRKSEYIFKELNNSKGIVSVSGMGLMIGIKTVKPAAEVINKCMENGVLCLTAKDKIRLLPALNIPMELLEKAIDTIKQACI